MTQYPKVKNPEKIGTYPASVKSGGGYVWDEVLEYRVWCHPEDGAPDTEEGNDYYHVFQTYDDALEFSETTPGAEEPIALILQEEYIDEPEEGKYEHIQTPRITEWHVEFLSRPRRTNETILNFISPNAPANRLDIIRGLANE